MNPVSGWVCGRMDFPQNSCPAVNNISWVWRFIRQRSVHSNLQTELNNKAITVQSPAPYTKPQMETQRAALICFEEGAKIQALCQRASRNVWHFHNRYISSCFGTKPTNIHLVNWFNSWESFPQRENVPNLRPFVGSKQTQWSMSTGLEKKENLGLLVFLGDQAGPSVTGSEAFWPPNTLRLCWTQSCLLTSASLYRPQQHSFIWIFPGW